LVYTALVMKIVHVAAVLLENENGEILVLRRLKNRPEPNTYGLPGGKVNASEDIKDACIRKVYEETKLTINSGKLVFLKTYNKEWQSEGINIIFETFRYKLPESNIEIVLDSKGASGFLWQTPQELYKRKDLMAGLYIILKDIYKLLVSHNVDTSLRSV